MRGSSEQYDYSGGFLIHNSAWGRMFVDHWLALTATKSKYPFTDNGGFSEATLRFGSRGMPIGCRYTSDACVKYINKISDKSKKSGAWVACLGKTKNGLMGLWNRTRNRDLGRVRFVATANGFNTHGWEQWKAKSGRTPDTFFQDGMFILHNKKFIERTPKSSVTCSQAKDADSEITTRFQKAGSFVLSRTGFCDLDSEECRQVHFRNCSSQHLSGIVGKVAIKKRVQLVKGYFNKNHPMPWPERENVTSSCPFLAENISRAPSPLSANISSDRSTNFSTNFSLRVNNSNVSNTPPTAEGLDTQIAVLEAALMTASASNP